MQYQRLQILLISRLSVQNLLNLQFKTNLKLKPFKREIKYQVLKLQVQVQVQLLLQLLLQVLREQD